VEVFASGHVGGERDAAGPVLPFSNIAALQFICYVVLCASYNGELHNLYSSPDIIRQIKSRRMRWAGHVARNGEGRNVYRVLVGKPEGKSPLERPRRRWEDRIKMHLREFCWGGWSRFTWLRIGIVVNAVMNLRDLAPRS
jgi:hypothetical protein